MFASKIIKLGFYCKQLVEYGTDADPGINVKQCVLVTKNWKVFIRIDITMSRNININELIKSDSALTLFI